MHPLRFPNSGIRAKVFVRKIGFKLPKAARRRGASPHAGAAAHGQATATTPCKGRLAAASASPKGAAAARRGGAYGQKRCPWARSVAASPQGRQLLAARRPQRGPAVGRSQRGPAVGRLQGATASKGCGASRRGGHPWHYGCQRARAAATCAGGGGGAEGERGVRASFGEKDDPTPINLGNSEDCPYVHNSHNTLNNSKNFEDYPLI
ncbi:hypothetical protein BHM03_00038132 [Ensete ventricosum]|nr:hypothetical protein BHM03_00038132 [Ensete ventricosum]